MRDRILLVAIVFAAVALLVCCTASNAQSLPTVWPAVTDQVAQCDTPDCHAVAAGIVTRNRAPAATVTRRPLLRTAAAIVQVRPVRRSVGLIVQARPVRRTAAAIVQARPVRRTVAAMFCRR